MKGTIKRDILPENFDSLETFWEFWDNHSSADYEDLMVPVEAEIDLSSSKIYCAIAKKARLVTFRSYKYDNND